MIVGYEVFLREAYLIHPLNFRSLCCMFFSGPAALL